VLFNVIINCIIVCLKEQGIGCNVSNMFIGCIIYVDDIILLSATVCGLWQMLDVSHNCLSDLQLSFNCNKSVCTVFTLAVAT